MLKLLVACGVDLKQVIIFIQSQVSAHTQLAHLLLCNTTIAQLMRMTQFKAQMQLLPEKESFAIPSGILTYPSLMAADILLYDVDYVLIGKDQTQHLELTVDIANKMNNKFQIGFKIPQALYDETASKIMALQEPKLKMSKSDVNQKNTIFLFESPKSVENKILQAITDSENKVYFNPEEKPGVSNLLTIYSALSGYSLPECEKILKHDNYHQLKKKVAEMVVQELTQIQQNYKQLPDDDNY
jgi:tryptophanyl-tRNA synthetase